MLFKFLFNELVAKPNQMFGMNFAADGLDSVEELFIISGFSVNDVLFR